MVVVVDLGNYSKSNHKLYYNIVNSHNAEEGPNIGIKDKWNDADIHIRRFMERKFNLHLLLIVNITIIGCIIDLKYLSWGYKSTNGVY